MKKTKLLISALKICALGAGAGLLKRRLQKREEHRFDKGRPLSDKMTVKLSKLFGRAADMRRKEEKKFFELMKKFR